MNTFLKMKKEDKLVIGIMAIVIIVTAYLTIGSVIATCTDSDGIDYFKEGNVTIDGNIFYDYCSGNELWEGSCVNYTENDSFFIPWISYNCLNGCENRSCINIEVPDENITIPDNETNITIPDNETNETCPVCPTCQTCSCGSCGSCNCKTTKCNETKYLTSTETKYLIGDCENTETIKEINVTNEVQVNKPIYKNIWFYGTIISVICLIFVKYTQGGKNVQ